MAVTDEATEADVQRPHFFSRLHKRLHANPVTGLLTKVVVTVIGTVVLLAGLVMMVTPGPGIVGIIAGLGILATEWHWARRLTHWARERAQAAAARAREMDPAVRRRRLLVTLGGTALVLAALAAYLYLYDWPTIAIDGWDWVQDISGAVPELPGM